MKTSTLEFNGFDYPVVIDDDGKIFSSQADIDRIIEQKYPEHLKALLDTERVNNSNSGCFMEVAMHNDDYKIVNLHSKLKNT